MLGCQAFFLTVRVEVYRAKNKRSSYNPELIPDIVQILRVVKVLQSVQSLRQRPPVLKHGFWPRIKTNLVKIFIFCEFLNPSTHKRSAIQDSFKRNKILLLQESL